MKFDPNAIALIPRDIAEKHVVIPIYMAGTALVLAMADPQNTAAISAVSALIIPNSVTVAAAPRADVLAAIARIYPR